MVYGLDHRPRKPRSRSWDGNIHGLKVLGHGVSGMVFEIDSEKVAKVDNGSPRSIEDIETEREAYRRLSNGCKYVLSYIEVDNPSGLVLEKCHDTVRKRLRSMYTDNPPPDETVQKWALQAAKGLAYVHRRGIIQGDVGCHNMLLGSGDTVKIGDFAGSSVNGSVATVDYELRSKAPGTDEPDERSDIFALGSAIYEMVTGARPYEDKTWREVHGLYKRWQFPKLNTMGQFQRMPGLARIIDRCWHQKSPKAYQHVQQVVDALDDMRAEQDSASSTSDYQDSLAGDSIAKPSRKDRQDSATYVHLASNRRHRSRKNDPDLEKGNEKHSYRKEKKKHHKSSKYVSEIIEFFSGSSSSSSSSRSRSKPLPMN